MTQNPQPENQHADTKADNTNPLEEIPIRQPPAEVSEQPPDLDQAEPHKKEGYFARYLDWRRDPYRKRASWTDKAIVMLTLGIVTLAFFQWLEMHDGGQQTGRIIGADDRIAQAMEASNLKAQAALDASILASRLDQRAWVVISPGKRDINVGDPIYLPLDFSNTGKTPALETQGFLVFKFITPTETLTFDKKGELPMILKTLFPNEKRPEIIPLITRKDVTSKPEPTILTRALFDQLNLGDLFTVVFGQLTYNDAFGTPHWLKFCEYVSLPTVLVHGEHDFRADRNAIKCAMYNEIDKNEPKAN